MSVFPSTPLFMQHFRHGSLPVRGKYTIYPTVLRRSASVLNSLGFPGCQWETDFSPEVDVETVETVETHRFGKIGKIKLST